jgi:hypothetical protein
MNRSVTVFALVAFLAVASSAAEAQIPVPVGPGFGPYDGFGPYGGFSPYNGYYGYGRFGGFGRYGPLHYSQQLFQQQSSLTQQIFQQQQQAIIDQIREAQGRAENLDAIKQQMFKQYLDMSDADKAGVRARLMTDYLSLDARRKEGWKRDGAIQTIFGSDLRRLDAAAQVRAMSEPNKIRFRNGLLQKYRLLSDTEQTAWQKDEIVGMVMGKEWWMK